jgi:hypothetical protein
MYALVHAEGRFFGAFVPLLVLGALAGLAPPAAAVARGRAAVVVAAAVAGALAAGDTHTARDVAAVLALAAAGACAWCLVRARGGGARAAAPATAAAAASAAAVGAAADVPPRAALLIAAGLAALALYGHGRPAALAGDRLRRGVLAVGAAFALLPVARLAAHLAGTARGGAARGAVWTPSPGGSPWEVATALRAAGVRPGDRVATVGTGDTAYWARLLRAQVVAEVPDSAVAALWAAPAGARDQLWRAFADVGVTAVVAAAVPAGTGPAAGAVATGWRPLGGGGAVLRLPRRPVPRPPGRSPRLPSPRP